MAQPHSIQDLDHEEEREVDLRPRARLLYANPAQRMDGLDRKVTEVRAMRRLAG